jgi:hypothetical protein
MISKRRCPHTGIVNFYSKADPLLAVGSVAQASMPAVYVWRCYLEDQAAGTAADSLSAEAQLRKAIARGQEAKPVVI